MRTITGKVLTTLLILFLMLMTAFKIVGMDNRIIILIEYAVYVSGVIAIILVLRSQCLKLLPHLLWAMVCVVGIVFIWRLYDYEKVEHDWDRQHIKILNQRLDELRKTTPNQALLPTTTSGTSPAGQEPRQP